MRVGVRDGDGVGVGVKDGVRVQVGVEVGIAVAVGEAVGVRDGGRVDVGVPVSVGVNVSVGGGNVGVAVSGTRSPPEIMLSNQNPANMIARAPMNTQTGQCLQCGRDRPFRRFEETGAGWSSASI